MPVSWKVEIDAMGRTWEWTDPGIKLEIGAAPLSKSAEGLRVSLSLRFPETVSMLQQRARGHDLSGAPARIFRGGALVLSGTVQDPDIGLDGSPVRMTIASSPLEDRAQWPEESAAVSSETWENPPDSSTGMMYPEIVGYPGRLISYAGSVSSYSGSQAVPVDTEYIYRLYQESVAAGDGSTYTFSVRVEKLPVAWPLTVIYWSGGTRYTCIQQYQGGPWTGPIGVTIAMNPDAGTMTFVCIKQNGEGPLPPDSNTSIIMQYMRGQIRCIVAGHRVSASSVSVRAASASRRTGWTRVSVEHVKDLLEREVAVIYLDGFGVTTDAETGEETEHLSLGSVVFREDESYYVAWIYGPGRTERGAGDNLLRWLQRSTYPADAAQLRAVLPALNVYRLDYQVSERVSPWEWIEAHLLPLLPVTTIAGPKGLELLPWDPDAPAGISVEEGRELSGRGDPSSSGISDLINARTASFCYDVEDGAFKDFRSLTGDKLSASTFSRAARSRSSSSLYARTSGRKYGKKEDAAAELAAVWDAVTVGLFLRWSLRASSFPVFERSYIVNVEDRFRIGQIVRLTDAGLYLRNGRAAVVGKSWNDSELTISLRVLSAGEGSGAIWDAFFWDGGDSWQ